uniref:Uncharacterized protein n=1 Tax=Amphimedon queenslandica TaxID=400682 RepID=A0A1X7VN85_AMPQE
MPSDSGKRKPTSQKAATSHVEAPAKNGSKAESGKAPKGSTASKAPTSSGGKKTKKGSAPTHDDSEKNGGCMGHWDNTLELVLRISLVDLEQYGLEKP